jgi:hypothetical protein
MSRTVGLPKAQLSRALWVEQIPAHSLPVVQLINSQRNMRGCITLRVHAPRGTAHRHHMESCIRNQTKLALSESF